MRILGEGVLEGVFENGLLGGIKVLKVGKDFRDFKGAEDSEGAESAEKSEKLMWRMRGGVYEELDVEEVGNGIRI